MNLDIRTARKLTPFPRLPHQGGEVLSLLEKGLGCNLA